MSFAGRAPAPQRLLVRVVRRLTLVGLVAVACGCNSVPPVPARYAVEIVAPPGGEAFAVPLGMNALGEVVGVGGPEAWHPLSRPVKVAPNGTAGFLDVPDANFGTAIGISDTGMAAGGYQMRPQVWDRAGRRHPLAVARGYFSGVATGVSAAGLIVGSYADSDDTFPTGARPCTWADVAAEPRSLAPLTSNGVIGAALAVNAAGQIAGYSEAPAHAGVAVRWDNPDVAPTPFYPATEFVLSYASGISSNGAVAGLVTFADSSAAAWWAQDRTPVLLPHHPAGNAYAEAFDVNRWGHVVGAASAGPETLHAVLWAEGRLVDLNDRTGPLPPGVRYLSSAVAINDAGFIAAEAVMDSGPYDWVRHFAVLRPQD